MGYNKNNSLNTNKAKEHSQEKKNLVRRTLKDFSQKNSYTGLSKDNLQSDK